ncbi:MAG: hypothetical protein ACE5OQ_11525 [Woeseia sp.]
MRIGGAGQSSVNILESEAGAFRGRDFAVSQNRCFVGRVVQTAVAGQFSRCQIFNPAGSGITLILDRIVVSYSSQVNFSIEHYDTELTTDVGAWLSKALGGAAGACHLRRDTGTANQGTMLEFYYRSANNPEQIEYKYPYMLDAGEGLHVERAVANTELDVNFYGREV